VSGEPELTPLAVAGRLAEVLGRAGVPVALGGALAYGFWAVPRATVDVDLNVFVGLDRLDEVLALLEEAGCSVDRTEARRVAVERGDFTASLSALRIDLFLSTIPAHDAAAQRIRSVIVGDQAIPILSPEDLLLFKVLFHRTKDLADIEHLVSARLGELDTAYVLTQLVDVVGETDERVQWFRRLLERLG